ncbi:MAG: FkbM family methyltransferase [Acidobacteriaceae bacterium]|nr:FkbM family methyltransferase [Acidobacteriaceae bacterium]
MRSSAIAPVLRGLSRVAGNRSVQSFLENCVLAAQYLQGIGAGADVSASGERAVLATLLTRAPVSAESLCIFDVGANTGQFLTLACQTLEGHRFHVYSFEPSSSTFKQLEETARKYRDVTVNNFALGQEQGERTLFSNAAGSGLASFSKRRLAHFGIDMDLSETVKVETLDGYCAAHAIGQIDLLKLDVEGHELAVLNGATNMFRASRIGMVTFEFGGCNIDSRTFVQDFFYFFRDHGMKIARITPSGFCHKLSSYREILEQFRTTNFVCFHP